jgi:ADP-dependent NAD(P)H-hydrate dehydratase / NAD(P)H-hydrate epimerase
MAAADKVAIESGTPAEMLMERAGRAVARVTRTMAGRRYGTHVAIVCGKGNNGGDGFVAARVLGREGMAVACWFVGDADTLRGAAAHHAELMRRTGVPIRRFAPGALRDADVIVDAIFGTGFRGAAEGDAAVAIDAINEAGFRGLEDQSPAAPSARVLAVDIPSGVDGATGRVDGPAVMADVTVAMAAEKVGTAVGRGAVHAGEVRVVPIGIPVAGATRWVTEANDVAGALPRRDPDSHKRSHGVVALLGGSAGMSGAVVLTARAAMRAGAGYATAGVSADVEAVLSTAVPEVLTRTVTDGSWLGPDALDHMKDVIERADAVAVGPGLGAGDMQAVLVERVLREVDVPVVVDADGLNVLAGRTNVLSHRSQPAVITPHPAELARLLDCSTEQVQDDRLEAATEAAHGFNCVVVLKGHGTVVANPRGEVVVNPTGGPELATAGTGDVLTGVVAALLAARRGPFEAAWAGAYLHGVAGSIAAGRHGAAGVVAGDVAEALPAAWDAIAGRP